jgi:hypothetical protein
VVGTCRWYERECFEGGRERGGLCVEVRVALVYMVRIGIEESKSVM